VAKRGYRHRDSDQIPTYPTTIPAIMATPEFALGAADARAGRPYRDSYQAWHTKQLSSVAYQRAMELRKRTAMGEIGAGIGRSQT
jgi:hypothetical protein